MKYISDSSGLMDADSGEDAEISLDKIRQQLAAALEELKALPEHAHPLQRIELQIKIAGSLVDLQRGGEAFAIAREAFDACAAHEYWEDAVKACNAMFLADQPESLAALGQGVWLSVTFPIDPELTVLMLNHIVDETPDDSDGAAIAAVTAKYVVDMRTQGKQHNDLSFYVNNLIATVARRHSKVESQAQFDYWFNKLELNESAKFLPRLRNVVDVLVQEDWWLDRDAIWAKLPDQ
ncbi:MAG: hypothetical protein L0Z73_06125 [Gammaproteobacteria bacterium]|nr:hypothetical protein [Gammaproteobacteria bacterium]